MESKKLLIAGIDPGITTAYAVLDIEGNLICLNSSKELDLNTIISKTTNLGKVVLVGTDKAKVPGLVSAFATKVGARIINPDEDLKVDEKRKMTSGMGFGDGHQSDALASALFAYKGTKQLLDKIDFFAERTKKLGIREKIKELVIANRISIKSAVGIIEKKGEEDKIIERVVEEKKLNENDFFRLYEKLKKYEKEVGIIRRYSNGLENRISNIEKSRKAASEKKVQKGFADFREKRIRLLDNSMKIKEMEIEKLKSSVRSLNNVISRINDFYVLKKLGTLGASEFNFRNKMLNIKRNDILLVDDANVASEDVISFLKNNVFVIVHKKPISKKTEENLPFVFISANNLKIEENKHFGFIEKRDLDAEKGKSNWIKKIVEDYKKEKQELISR